ncbi:MAG: hypothetical protein J2P54_25805 [Bradyrhizobiaceae bacterium]|nr:hypothetical protein [Bradyrhizobiaceae bacterium]
MLAPASSRAQNAYVANDFSNTVSVVDTATNTVAATIPVGRGPVGVTVSPDGSKAYVTNHFSNTLSVIDTATTLCRRLGASHPPGFRLLSNRGAR